MVLATNSINPTNNHQIPPISFNNETSISIATKINKKPWSTEEDAELQKFVDEFGTNGSW